MKRRGIVKGRTIEFDEPLGLPEGRWVEADIWPAAEPEMAMLSPGEFAMAETDDEALPDTPTDWTFHPIPPRGYVVTNEMVNQWREELGI